MGLVTAVGSLLVPRSRPGHSFNREPPILNSKTFVGILPYTLVHFPAIKSLRKESMRLVPPLRLPCLQNEQKTPCFLSLDTHVSHTLLLCFSLQNLMAWQITKEQVPQSPLGHAVPSRFQFLLSRGDSATHSAYSTTL